MTDFFISHAHSDRQWAEWIAWTLEEAGYKVALQNWDFRPGANFVVEMGRTAMGAASTMVLLSPEYLSNLASLPEWAAAFAEDPTGGLRRLVPVRIRPVELKGLLAQIVFIDLVGLGEEDAKRFLLTGLQRGRGKPAKPPSFPGTSHPVAAISAEFPRQLPDRAPQGEAKLFPEMPIDQIPLREGLTAGSRVPYPPDPTFVNRKAELKALAQGLGALASDPKVLVVRGPAGIGKTALAAEFAHRYGAIFTGGVQWVSFCDERSIPAEIAACGLNDERLQTLEFEGLPLSNQVRLVQSSWNSPVSRLLVFDDCEDHALLERWLPEEGGARVLVTSRRLDCPTSGRLSGMQVLSLPALTNAESVVLLRRCQPDPKSQKDEVFLAAIATELQGIPLALHLAGGQLHSGSPKVLLQRLRAEGGRQSTIDWALLETLGRLDEKNPVEGLARTALARAACFAPSEPIPLRLLAASVGTVEENCDLADALARLACDGVIAQGTQGVVLQPRVAEWLRETLVSVQDQAEVENVVFQQARRLTEGGESLRILPWQAHLRVVTDAAKDREDVLAAELCWVLGEHLAQIGERYEARRYLERALAIREKLSLSGVETAIILEDLGSLFFHDGDSTQARALRERALANRLQIPEADPYGLAKAYYDLGLLVQARGDLRLARQYFEEALAIWERLLGPYHPDTAAVRNLLQFLKGEQDLVEKELVQAVPWGEALLKRLRRDGSWIVHLRATGPNRWLLRARIPRELQVSYGTAPEILVLVVFGEVQGRDLSTAQQELQKKDLDLDPDLLVVVDDRPSLSERLSRLPLLWGQWVSWPVSNGDLAPLAEQFRRHLPLFDVFEQRDPVRGRQVIGRNKVVSDLSKRLQQGQAIGVFGLRKVGKTTVLRAVADKLDPLSARLSYLSNQGAQQVIGEERASMIVIWLDLERLVERSLPALTKQLRRDIERRFAAGDRLLSGNSLPETTDPGALFEAILERTEIPVCLVLDEYDLLFEGSEGQPAIAGIETLFRAFRAWAQQTGRLALAVIGRDPQFLEQPELGGYSNPMLNWVIPCWLGPLPELEADELLERLGRRVLLDVGPETRELARHWTGGHPMLHRQFGSALLDIARKRMPLEGHCATDPFRDEAVDRFLARDAVITICREVFHLLASRYPDASALLEDLCWRMPGDVAGAIEGHGGWWQPSAQTLRNFGLLLGDRRSSSVAEVFRLYLRTMTPQRKDRRA